MKMKNDQLLQVANEQIKSRKYRKWYYSAFVSLAVIVIFCTVYALILPAITMTTKQENTTPEPIPITGQISDLFGLGIYPGELREGGTWVAYDAESETNANVKAVITLPEGGRNRELLSFYPQGKFGRSLLPDRCCLGCRCWSTQRYAVLYDPLGRTQ